MIGKKLYTTCCSLLFILNVFSSYSYADELVDLPRELEIKLALSALPKALQSNASVYVLDKSKGYILHKQGNNGFMTFVARTSTRFYASDWVYEYPSDQIIPISFDSVGMAHHLIPWFDIAKLRAKGTSPSKAKEIIKARFADGTYTAPKNGGISYMLSPIHRAYMRPEKSADIMTVSMPHYMPYAPYVTSSQLGGLTMDQGGIFVLTHGDQNAGPHGYLVFMLPPARVAEIRHEYKDLLDELCSRHENWCLKSK